MLTYLRRFFVLLPAIRDIRERLSTVEADLEYLALELKRLRGRVTGGIRRQDAPGSTNGEVPAFLQHMDPVSRRIWQARLAGRVPVQKEG